SASDSNNSTLSCAFVSNVVCTLRPAEYTSTTVNFSSNSSKTLSTKASYLFPLGSLSVNTDSISDCLASPASYSKIYTSSTINVKTVSTRCAGKSRFLIRLNAVGGWGTPERIELSKRGSSNNSCLSQ